MQVATRTTRYSPTAPAFAYVIATGIALGIAVSLLAATASHLAALGMVVAVAIAAGVLIWALGQRLGAVVLLVFCAFLVRYTFSLGRLDIRAEQVAAAIALGIVAYAMVRERSIRLARPDYAEIALVIWFVLGLAASLIFSLSKFDSVKVWALYVVSSLGLLLPRRLLSGHAEELEGAVHWLLVAFAIESLYALAAYFLHLLGPTLAMSVNRGQLSVYGTLWEPNVLGAVCAAGAIAWTFLGRRYFGSAWIGMALCASATVVSFTRTAWIALGLVLALKLIVPPLRRMDMGAVGIAALATVIMIGLTLAAERVVNYYPGQAGYKPVTGSAIGGDIGNPADVQGRFDQIHQVLGDLKHHPILGGGMDSFGQHHVFEGAKQHVANLELLVLNDTGVLGTVAFAAVGLLIVLAFWRRRDDPLTLGLGAMVLVIAITNQATETLELLITWLLVGFLLSAVDAAPTGAKASARTTPGSAS